MNMKKIIIFILCIVLLPQVSATDWTIGNPMGIGYTNNPAFTFTITNNNASTGSMFLWLADPITPSSTTRIINCNNCLYGATNPIDNTFWGTDEQGNVFYIGQYGVVDYSLGFYTVGESGCTNCNPLFRVGILTAVGYGRKITFDSSGNAYTYDGSTITKYVKSIGYSPQNFYTLVSGTDYTARTGTANIYIIGISTDASDNLHILIGTNACGAGVGAVSVNRAIISSTGTHITADLSIRSYSPVTACGFGYDGYDYQGGLILDSTNPTQNYTYSFVESTGAPAAVTYRGLMHNSSSGTVDIFGATLTGITSIGDIAYNNFQIYLSSPGQNLIRLYATNFEGYGFSQAPSNPDGITGTFDWKNGYGVTVTTISPGAALAYRWTVSENNANYTYYTGWASSVQSEPPALNDLTQVGSNTGVGSNLVFNTNSNDLAGRSIYGYIVAKRTNDSTWSLLGTQSILTISPAAIGYDSITLDKSFYNLTGDTITATFTYSSSGIFSPYIYKWQLCSRADCADGSFFNQISLIGNPQTSTMTTDGMSQGNYYAVLMRHLPVLTGLTNTIVASQRFEVRPPVIGVSWDKPSYNLFPKTSASSCLDATPAYFPWSNISGYAGLQRGWFSCSVTPADANANNSIMRGSLFARYNGTFYLNNSLGNVWNGTLYNGSGALIYTLTNSSVTETWSLVGVNESGETFYATTEVNSESLISYSISVSPSTAYNMDTLYLTFSRPIWRVTDYVIIKDAGGTTITTFSPSAKSGTYYIDPAKSYTYGTWTAYWDFGSIDPIEAQNAVYTFRVINAGRPTTNASTDPENSAEYTSSEITGLLSSKIFWALLFIIGIMLAVAVKERRGS